MCQGVPVPFRPIPGSRHVQDHRFVIPSYGPFSPGPNGTPGPGSQNRRCGDGATISWMTPGDPRIEPDREALLSHLSQRGPSHFGANLGGQLRLIRAFGTTIPPAGGGVGVHQQPDPSGMPPDHHPGGVSDRSPSFRFSTARKRSQRGQDIPQRARHPPAHRSLPSALYRQALLAQLPVQRGLLRPDAGHFPDPRHAVSRACDRQA